MKLAMNPIMNPVIFIANRVSIVGLDDAKLVDCV